ncbi:glycosyltransferase [Microlunatus sp. Gsoil 973]|uniref:glycosyltransferase n=1 Tax=Microlunatus sp. Gsoil 973 TaxID=2672569 RepID=UPI0018A7EBDE|nr:glycosyltransferase [Microlunatus sp. Gsoil 973]
MLRAHPKTLLVAATGGHLEQLYRIRPRLVPECGEIQWVTHDDPQSRSLLAGERVTVVPYVPPRGYREIARNTPAAWKMIRNGHFDRVISTGAGVAIPFLAAARMSGVECHYIESAARADGPSVTGRIAARMPGVRLYSQYQAWAGGDWNYRGSLFDSFEPQETDAPQIRRVVVTLGTMRTYGFRRAVDHLLQLLPQVTDPGAEILWQVGVTDPDGISGDVRSSVPNAELRDAIGAADLVIAHAGIGSAITALELGKRPVLIPRRPQFNEHVDDHQSLIAGELGRRRLAVSAEADVLTTDDLIEAASARVISTDAAGPFRLRTAS